MNTRRKIPETTWAELRTAHAAGCGLRQLARNMNIPAGTVLARAKHERWTARIQEAKAIAPVASSTPTIAPADAAASIMADFGDRSRFAAAKASCRALEHAASLPPDEVLQAARHVKDFTGAASTVHGWGTADGPIGINILSQNVVIQARDGQ